MKKFIAGTLLGSQLLFSQVVAVVNGEKITDKDLLPAVSQISQGRFATLSPQVQERVWNMALEQVIAQILIEKEAKSDGTLKDREFQKDLEIALKAFKRQVIADLWIKREFDKIHISEKELKEYYQKHISEFVQPQQVHARHILLKTEQEAKYLISILSKYHGERLQKEFIEVAKQHSIGPSGKNGGDLGYFAKGTMVPEFDSAVFSMDKGEISKTPVKTNFGYHIIYIEDVQPAKTLSFDEVKQFIEQKIKVEKFQEFVRRKIEELKSKANIKIY